MASPPPRPAPAKAPAGRSGPEPPPRPAPATAAAASQAGPQPPPRGPRPFYKKDKFLYLCLIVFLEVCVVLVLGSISLFCVVPPSYPTVKVAGLIVSNLTVAAPTGATWNADLLVERSWIFGRLFFTEVECFLYYHWDAAQRLAVAPAKPFMLRRTDRTVVKTRMTMGRPEEAAVAEDMDRERRSVGTVVVGLGLRMRGAYAYASWAKKKDIGHIEVRCDDLRIAFANSTTEGSLVTGADIATEDHPAVDNLPSCS
ncbi:uncharacterized protein LOC130139800 [Syzygium oleosum]|uniref:uncharacterized protein LOC130139800 n=1 Tax=Syzygium oleosum TaxID=219896 RepID=UPI0024BA8423|nr:uncharacterized protein LOC130139800 [Syzygium oleosum]